MKILVTGGAGYIGSHVLNLLGKTDHEIIVVDNLSTGRKESILYGKHYEKDLEDLEFMSNLFNEYKFDSVFHFAGSIIVPESVENPIKYYQNNVVNSLNLIKLCVKNSVKNFIFSSTATVYGMPEGVIDENTPLSPINPYGHTKLMTEQMLKDVCAVSDMNYVALRYFNVAGANVEGLIGQCSPESTHLLKIAAEVVTGKRDKLFIHGDDYPTRDGTCIRDYIHVDDLAQAHIDALKYLESKKESLAINVGYGEGYTVKEVVDALKELYGDTFKCEQGPRRAGDASILLSKADRVREVFGWQPKYNDLKLIIKTAVDWEAKL